MLASLCIKKLKRRELRNIGVGCSLESISNVRAFFEGIRYFYKAQLNG